MTILDQIIAVKKEEVERLKRQTPLGELRRMSEWLPPPRSFRSALESPDCRIIAEVKRRSPSKGMLCKDFDAVRIASAYEKNGAAAVSVLTDKEFFAGEKGYLIDVRARIKIPILRKDFIIDPAQIYETRLLGGDALLLIAAVLDPMQMSDYLALTRELGLSALVEVHDREDLDKALAAGAGIIGINNRNLRTFVTDVQTSLDLKAAIPEDRIVVSESGIQSRADIERLMAAGIRAFLIGETLIRAKNRGAMLRELLGK